MKDNPLISIYMPTWNRQQLAIRAIKSVLRQDYSNWEMIIVDDCSTSWEQLQQYVSALNDPRITYIHNDINSGACAVRNQAIMLAQGEYITVMDSKAAANGRGGLDFITEKAFGDNAIQHQQRGRPQIVEDVLFAPHRTKMSNTIGKNHAARA